MPDEKTVDELFRRQLNLARATQWVHDFVLKNVVPTGDFVLESNHICYLHKLCMLNLLPNPGDYRTGAMRIGGRLCLPASKLKPHMDEFINDLNRDWPNLKAIEIGARAIWGLNWIHPFPNGNGRTSRQLSYLLMNMKAGYLFPGKPGYLIPEQLGGDLRDKYVTALRHGDDGDLGPIEELLAQTLHSQLANL